MKTSHLILTLHYVCLLTVVSTCSSTYWIAKADPIFYRRGMFPVLMLIAALTLLSWPVFGGCPLTKWENKHIAAEGGVPYKGSCMVYRLNSWTGRQVNPLFIHVLLVTDMIVIPVTVFFLE